MRTEPESYIAAHEAAERQQRRAWSLWLLFVGLHLGYFAFPVLPFAGARAWFPLLAVLPPVFALGYTLAVVRVVRGWRRTRESSATFLPIPPRQETAP
jgi:hypothetical protein